MKKLFLLSLLSVVLLILPLAVSAQCDCDFIISTSATEWLFDGAAKGVKPGDKICFASGTRNPIAIYNINGTPENPVTITNMCDGKVTIKGVSGNPYAIEIHKSSNFKFSGAGNASQQYGIELTGTVFGIDVKELSTDFEIDHLKLTSLTDCGIIGKTDPTCDQSTWRGNFTMKNTKFHDNYIENIGGEGFYIGNSHYHTTVAKSCSGTTINVQEHEVINVQVYNNIVKSTGRDGIQVGGATSGCTIHHNDIYNTGTKGEATQNSGIQINPGTNADCYDNKVDTGTGTGIFDVGRGGSHIYNNLIMNQGDGGISAQDYPPVDTRGYIFANNTLINNKNYGMYMYSQNTLQNIFINNIIVATNQSGYKYVALNNPSAIKWTASNNIQTADVNSIKFANAAGKDYHLTTASALALNVGKDATANGVTADFEGTARPQGGLFDIGAFEFKTTTTANQAPVASAGADKAITLPTSSATLTGTATDSDGTIASYAWTKVSGGAATLTNASTATLSVSALVAGTYTFRLTVTDNAGATAADDVVLTVSPAPNVAPVASAGADKAITLPTSSTTLTGTATDSDGTVASYTWTKVSGGAATLTNASTATLSLSGLVAGTYTFRLTVTDNSGAAASDDVILTVNPAPNVAPVASAGADKAITLPTSSTTLTGTATDSDGTIASYSWTKVSGGAATLTNASTATLGVSAVVAGTYTFRFTVTDNSGATASDDVVLTVNAALNVAPMASAGADKAITLPTSSTTFAGTATDADGTVASYAWTKVSGGAATLTNASTATVTVTGLVAGTYTFRLTATDNSGATGSDDVTLTVYAAAPITVASSAKFAFTNAATGISGWNELAGAPHAAVISKTDAATGITVSSVATNQWNPVNYGSNISSFNGGVTNGTVQPAAVVKCNWFTYNAAYNSTVNGVVQKDNIAISGLNPTHKYKLQMGASRATGAGTSDQYGTYEYRINGTNVKTLLVTNNCTLQVEYTTISPDASGKIGISARKVAGSTMNFGYMGWLVITDETSGITTGREVAQLDEETAADTVAAETAAVSANEEGFTFNDRTYAGTHYGLVIFNGQGKQIYAGEYKDDMYQSIFNPGELYVYHVIHEGKKVDTGKIFVTRQ